MNIYMIVVALYFVGVTLIGSFTRKVATKSASDYLIAGRNMGIIVCSVVVAAEWLGGMSTIGVSEKSFNTMTLQPILYNFSTALGMIIIGFTVASHYRKREVHTVSEMLESLFGNKTRKISAIAFLIAYIVLAYVQLQTCAGVLAPLFQVSWNVALVVSAVIITFYTYFGGMHALAITGIVYLITMFFGIGTAFIVGINNVGGFMALQEKLLALGSPENPFNPFSGDLSGSAELLIGGILGGMAAQASIQPIFGAKDVPTAKYASVLAAFFVAPFGVMTGFLGLIAKTGIYFPAQGINAKMAMTTLLTTPEFIHPLLGSFALAGILAAILSTVGPVNFAVVTIAAKDIYHGFINPQADDAKIVATARKLVVIVSIVTLPLAVLMKGAVLDMAYISYAVRAIGAIVIVLGIYGRKLITPNGVNASFFIGLIVIFACVIGTHFKWFSFNKTFGAVISTLLIIAIFTIIDKVKGAKGANSQE